MLEGGEFARYAFIPITAHLRAETLAPVRLLLAEDDPFLSAMLAKGLREHAYAVDVVADGETAVIHSAVNEYDLVVLDIMLPRRDGFAVCREIRRRGSVVPVLMLTARDALADKVEGLDAGADDYLAKPFEFAELLARLRALLRRAREIRDPELVVADLVVDTRAQTARRGGTLLPLTTKEYALLEFLARNAGRVLSRAEISGHVWDENHDPLSNALEVCITRLRRKLDDGRPALIHTRRGAGYLLAELPGLE
jgi:DNA-binding response OmpR family regulator